MPEDEIKDTDKDESKDDTRKLEAFDLVTEALEKIDAHQQSITAPGRASRKDLLINAEELLSKAQSRMQAADPEFFKAEYFQAMVSYLSSKPGLASDQFETLQKSFYEKLSLSAKEHALSHELNYNLAASLFEAKRYDEAITLFEETAGIVTADLEVRLLAHAGAALARGTQTLEAGVRGEGKAKEHYRFIRKELAPFSFPQLVPLVRFLRGKKPIDKEVAYKVQQIIKRTKRLSRNDTPSSGEESDGHITVPT